MTCTHCIQSLFHKTNSKLNKKTLDGCTGGGVWCHFLCGPMFFPGAVWCHFLSGLMCNGGKVVLTFVHWSTRFTGSQGPSGLGYGPLTAAVWLLWASKVIVVGLLPMAITQDVTSYASYRISGRWRIRYYITIYVMYRQYKSGCNPVLGSPFASPVAGDISTPLPIEPP